MQKLNPAFLLLLCLLMTLACGDGRAADEVLVPREPGSGWTTAPATDEVLVPNKQTLGQNAANEVLLPKDQAQSATPSLSDGAPEALLPHVVARSDQNCSSDSDCAVVYLGCSLCGVENGSWEAVSKGAMVKYKARWNCTAEERKLVTPHCKSIEKLPATPICVAKQCVVQPLVVNPTN